MHLLHVQGNAVALIEWRRVAYGEGGFGERSTDLISRMSSFGSAQKNRGLSPGTLNASLIATWPGIHDGDAETEMAEMAARMTAVILMVNECGRWLSKFVGKGVEEETALVERRARSAVHDGGWGGDRLACGQGRVRA